MADDLRFALADGERGPTLADLLDDIPPRRRATDPAAFKGLALTAALRALADDLPLGLGHQSVELQLLSAGRRGGVDVLSD
ncbi:hypothetical protein OHA71_30185 [Streptomyces sp. NBC_00444]